MDLRRGRLSRNIEDRRGLRMPGNLKLGGCGSLLLLVVLVFFFGPDSLQLLNSIEESSPNTGYVDRQPNRDLPADEGTEFISRVLANTEDTWTELFGAGGLTYQQPSLVLFSGMVESACGYQSAAVGPFYCPGDRKIYLDLTFFDELAQLGGRGDFAQAYVLAHEVGHHVQNQLRYFELAEQLKRRNPSQSNAISVRFELQADCLAGVWAHHGDRFQQILEPGDLEEGLTTAAAIGDDRLSRLSGQVIAPESFTHGSSRDRAEWLRRGLETGDFQACDTFKEILPGKNGLYQ